MFNRLRIKFGSRDSRKTLNEGGKKRIEKKIFYRKKIRVWFVTFLSTLFLALLIVVPVGAFVYFVFFTDAFVVRSIAVLDTRPHTEQAVKKIVGESVDDSTFRGSIFFVQVDILESEIKSSLPQVRTVHITRKLPETLKVYVQEKEPRLLLYSSGDYYFIDDKGVPYEQATLDKLPGTALPVIKNDDQQAKIILGTTVLDPMFIDIAHNIQEGIRETLNAEVADIRIPSLAAKEIYVFLDNNWKMMFNASRPIDQQLNMVREILNKTIPEEDHGRIEYMDLRIPSRVYYKLR